MSIKKEDIKLGDVYLMNSGKRRKIVAAFGEKHKDYSLTQRCHRHLVETSAKDRSSIVYEALDTGDYARRDEYYGQAAGSFSHHANKLLSREEEKMEVTKDKYCTFDHVGMTYMRHDSLEEAKKYCEEQLKGGQPGPYDILTVTGIAERYCVQFKEVK